MKYTYTAVFTPTQDGKELYARVPDLPGCVTTGDNIEDAIEQITDAAGGWLVVAEDQGLAVPAPTPQAHIPHESWDTLSLIRVDTIAYRALTDTRSVRKNVSLPAWLANLADQRGLNCSKLLQDALRQALA